MIAGGAEAAVTEMGIRGFIACRALSDAHKGTIDVRSQGQRSILSAGRFIRLAVFCAQGDLCVSSRSKRRRDRGTRRVTAS